jgi:hypothetical protein
METEHIQKSKSLILYVSGSTIIPCILRYNTNNLKKRCVIVVDRCCLCKRNVEFVDHLLLHYEVACALWNAIFSHFGISWVMLIKYSSS